MTSPLIATTLVSIIAGVKARDQSGETSERVLTPMDIGITLYDANGTKLNPDPKVNRGSSGLSKADVPRTGVDVVAYCESSAS